MQGGEAYHAVALGGRVRSDGVATSAFSVSYAENQTRPIHVTSEPHSHRKTRFGWVTVKDWSRKAFVDSFDSRLDL